MTVRLLNELIEELKTNKDSLYSKFGCQNASIFSKNIEILVDIINFIRNDKRNEEINFDGIELSTPFKNLMLDILGIFKKGEDTE